MSSVGKSYNNVMTPEEERRVLRTGMGLMALAFLFMGGFAYLVHYDFVKLYPATTTTESVKGYAGRVEFALRYQTLLALWLVFNTIITIIQRGRTKAVNPLDDRTENRVQIFKNILANSFETIVVSVFSQLTFVSFASPIVILKFIPLINIIQFVGRIAFFAGYPLKRAFGFICTFFPTFVLTIYNTYKLGSFLGAY